MKKWIAIILALAMLLSMTACTGLDALKDLADAVEQGDLPELPDFSDLPELPQILPTQGSNDDTDGEKDNQDADGGGSGWWPFPTQPTTQPTDQTVPTGPEEPTQPTVPVEPSQPQNPTGPSTSCDVTLWIPSDLADSVRAQIDRFNRENSANVTIQADIRDVSCQEAYDALLSDPAAAADIFCLHQDQIPVLAQRGALAPLDREFVQDIQKNYDSKAMASASYQGQCYAYPMALNNGYFLYYDKSVISDAEAGSLEAIIAACERNGRYFSFELENAWYVPSFFFATGCVSQWEVDADGEIVGINDSFNSYAGRIALAGMNKLVSSKVYKSDSSIYDLGDRYGSAAVVSGTWNYDGAHALLGNKLGIAPLPSFTVDGKSYHLGSYSGYYLMSMKPQADAQRAQALQQLMAYLNSEQCQLERLSRNAIPTHLAAQKSQLLQDEPCAQVLLQQSAWAVPQGPIHGSWWDIGKKFPYWIKMGYSHTEMLSMYQSEVEQVLTAPEYGWSVIGDVHNTQWSTDFPMEEFYSGIYRTTQPLLLHEYSEFKIRYNRSWDINYGADGVRNGANVMPGVSGYFYIFFEASSGIVWVEESWIYDGM